MSVHGTGECAWGTARACMVCGVSVHAEGEYMGHGVSVHREKGVHSMGWGGVRSGDECAHGVGCAQDSGGAQGCQGTRMGLRVPGASWGFAGKCPWPG